MKIGIISDSFRLDLKGGLKKAAELGAHGVQIYAVAGEMAPENLNAQQRKDLKAYIADLGLEVSALCGDMGGHAFQNPDENAYKVERSCRIMDLALDLDCHVVTTHIGVVPSDELTEITKEYDPKGDAFLAKLPAAYTPVRMKPNSVCILFPEDGHAPCMDADKKDHVRKLIAKVRVV